MRVPFINAPVPQRPLVPPRNLQHAIPRAVDKTPAEQPRQRRVGHVEVFGPIDDAMATRIENQVRAFGHVDDIVCAIDTTGGTIPAMNRILAALRSVQCAWLTTVNMGQAWSAGFRIFLEGNERLVTSQSDCMLHNVHVSGDDTNSLCVEDSEKMAAKLVSVAYSVDLPTAREWRNRQTHFDARETRSIGISTGYSSAPTRTPVDPFSVRHVEPPYGFEATKAFEAKVAGKSKPKPPPPPPSPTRPIPKESDGRPHRNTMPQDMETSWSIKDYYKRRQHGYGDE